MTRTREILSPNYLPIDSFAEIYRRGVIAGYTEGLRVAIRSVTLSKDLEDAETRLFSQAMGHSIAHPDQSICND